MGIIFVLREIVSGRKIGRYVKCMILTGRNVLGAENVRSSTEKYDHKFHAYVNRSGIARIVYFLPGPAIVHFYCPDRALFNLRKYAFLKRYKKLCALLYKKCLSLNADGRRSITIGKIINIMSVDVNRCDRILLPFSNISVSPILGGFSN